MTDCIFCKIIKKEVPADIFFEDETGIVFTPLNPITKGHILVVPKTHSENIFDIDEEVLKSLITTSKKVAIDTVKKHNATGVNLLHASGTDAQQSVFHFHLHIVPRYPNDGLDLWLKNRL
jgi:histidine triad (HIT) family protein